MTVSRLLRRMTAAALTVLTVLTPRTALTPAAHAATGGAGTATRMSFYLDDTAAARTPAHVENYTSGDLRGGSDTTATGWNTAAVANCTHTLTVRTELSDGRTRTATTTFTVTN